MLLSEISLLVLAGMGVILSPIYLYVRSKMTRSNKPHEYSKKRIFRVVGMHFLMMFGITVINTIILQALLTGSQFLSQKAIFVISLHVLFLAAALYGSGIYITSILFETFVSRKYLVIRFLHGPLSHTIIFASYLGIFANLSFIANELEIHSSIQTYGQIFLLLGIISGIVAAIDNLANGILLLSVITSAVTLALFLFVNSTINTFSVFFLGLEGGFLIAAMILLFKRLLKGHRFSWYEPVNIFE